jgi:hypothetical protein
LLPDAGGSTADITASGGLLGGIRKDIPIHQADSWEVAANKYNMMRTSLLSHWSDAANIDEVASGGGEATGDIMDSLKASGAITP